MKRLNHHESARKLTVLCLVLLVIAFVAAVVFKISFGNIVLFGLALACPIMHLWMMNDGGHKH